MASESESKTTIVEIGKFTRIYERKGKRKRVRTKREKKNPKKVVLAKINDLELYVIPYDFPDCVFLGVYPEFTMKLEKHDIPKLLVFYNKARWFIEQKWLKKRHRTKRAENTSTSILKAYNFGVKKLKEAQKRRKKI